MYEESRTDTEGCRQTFLVLVVLFVMIVLGILFCKAAKSQPWQYENKGLYPNSISATVNARNTAIGIKYGHLFDRKPLGVYTSFSNTISPNPNYCSYDWERKYSIGGIITIPQAFADGLTHTMFTLGVVYNSHPEIRHYNMKETHNIGCDIGIQMQQKHFTAHLKADVVNWMNYIEFGAGWVFSFHKSY